MSELQRVVGYLSGAPRVSTRWHGESGGARSHVLGVIGGFEQEGWQVKRFIFGDMIDTSSQAASAGSKLLQNNMVGRMAADILRVVLGKRSSSQARRLLGRDLDFVYERYAVFQALGRSFQKAGVPWIVETQGLFFHEAKFERSSITLHGLARRHEHAVYREADVVVAVTQVLKELILREFPDLDAEKILVVPNGVDTERFAPRLGVPHVFSDGVTLGFVGGLLKWQGLDILLRALANCQNAGVRYNLLVAGDGAERDALEALAKELGLQERIRFLGRVDGNKIPDVISQFDLGFSGHIPSQIGGMYHSPLKLYEYMAMGKPVLASDFSDARALVLGRGTGFLFTPGSVDVLTRALLECDANAANFSDMGQRARELVLREHSWRARVAEMIKRFDATLVVPRSGR